MTEKVRRIPSLCKHRATGQGVVRLNGKDHYLGRYKSKECKDAYRQLIHEWTGNDHVLPDPKAPPSVNEILADYMEYVLTYSIGCPPPPRGDGSQPRFVAAAFSMR